MIENVGACRLPDGRGDAIRLVTRERDVNAVIALKRREHRLQHGDVHRISQVEENPAPSERPPDGPIDTSGGAPQPCRIFSGTIAEIAAVMHSAAS